MMSRLIEHDGRWIRALLILATLTVGLVFIGLAADIIVYFSDIILIVIMAWVFAFVLNPVVDGAGRVAPAIPRIVVVVVVYGLLFIILAGLGLIIATQLANSIIAFTDELPTLQQRVPEIVDPWQAWLADLGLQVDLVVVLDQGLQELARSSGQFVGPLQDVAFASLGMLGNLIFMIFLSLFIVADKDNLLGFVHRVTPPQYAPEMRLFQTSVASSFGGFMRGQAIQAVVLGSVAAAGSLLLDIDYMPLTTALVAVFQFIPFFGPFISWAPPVIAGGPDRARRHHPHRARHGRRLVRDHELRAAAGDVQLGRHPPGGRAAERAHRSAPPGRRGSHLRHPGGGRHQRLLLPLPLPPSGWSP